MYRIYLEGDDGMFRKLVTLCALTLAGSATASAADLPMKAPMAVPYLEYNWTGFYVGAFAGYSSGDVSDFVGPVGGLYSISPKGWIGGVHAGYDYQFANRFVLGARIAVPFASSVDGSIADPLLAGVRYEGGVNWAVLVTGHIGYAVGRWLPYVGIGAAFAGAEATLVNITPGTGITPGTRITDSNVHVGYTLLAGVRYALTNNWWVAGQYNYVDFGSQDYSWVAGQGFRSIDFSSHTVTGMISYRF